MPEDKEMEDKVLKVYLQPRSSKNEIAGLYRDGIKITVTAPPTDGKANEALIQLLAKELKIPPTRIEILKGHHSREKILRISGIKSGMNLFSYSKNLDFKGKIV